jgi:hypothetical protein
MFPAPDYDAACKDEQHYDASHGNSNFGSEVEGSAVGIGSI